MRVAHRGDAQANTLDRTGRVSDVDHVAHTVLVLEQHEDSSDEVSHQVLRAKLERDADDARGCDEGGHVHS